ncbi:hypothetical protein PsorP6_006515 [Peronosclerospora sorghi]|uniref:Uncharacterized protein n=1 Tax=Peronosclerospora sorghi TaxID=230839 RepID=A0ACC0W2G0_9STRA|nr:hypothetical protein PsorP6_006515 [Peronosclerospora sorghi]
MGILGSFALHHMMSPEIEALTQQCERLKNDVLLLRLQVEHVTSIAEGRLETINLIETELEQVRMQAAKFVATPTPGVKHIDIPSWVYDGLKDDELGVVLPTIFYTLWVGFVVLAYVMYRVFLIVRGEMITRKLVTKFYAIDHGSSGFFKPSVLESSGSGRAGRKISPSLTRVSKVDDLVIMVAEALLTVLILLKVQKKLKNARHSAISGRQDYRSRLFNDI